MTQPATDPNTSTPTTDPQSQNQPPSNDDPEKGFWDKLEKTVERVVGAEVDKRIKTVRESATGDKRGNGRTTLPKVLADFIFGPEKP
jgi:hypothetical protein